MGKRKLFWVVTLFGLLAASAVSAQGVNTDIFGPAARAVDGVRMSQSVGLFAAVIFCFVGAAALWFKSMKIAITGLFLVAGTILWYSGGDIAKSMIPTSGTAIAP
jgi:hypothetical protein